MPDFTNAQWQAAHTKADLSEAILNGQDAMPAYKGDLGGLTPGQLVEYVRTFANQGSGGASKATAPSDPKGSAPGDPPTAADPPPVAQFYQQHCASCHGANGRNPQLQKIFPDMPDFTNAPWQAAHTKADLSEAILNGQDAMPAYKGDLGGLTAGQLVEYLRTFAKPAKSQ